jgi:MFS family permease
MDVVDLTKVEAGWIVSFWGIGLIFGCPFMGFLSDKIFKARRSVTVVGGLLHTAGWAFIALNPAGWTTTTIVIWCLYMGITGGTYIINYAHIAESVPRAVVGTAIGCFNVFCFAWGSFLQPWIGHILDGFGRNAAGKFPVDAYEIMFWIFAIGMLIGSLAMIFSRETYLKR